MAFHLCGGWESENIYISYSAPQSGFIALFKTCLVFRKYNFLSGAFGTVWLADLEKYSVINETSNCAVKLLRSDVTEKNALEFLMEMEIMSKLHHAV